jgi:hypothetical protein
MKNKIALPPQGLAMSVLRKPIIISPATNRAKLWECFIVARELLKLITAKL